MAGHWSRTLCGGLKGYVGYNYLYGSSNSKASVRFEFQAPVTGRFEVRLAYGTHPNRGTSVPVSVHSVDGEKTVRVNMRVAPDLPNGFISLGTFQFHADQKSAVVVSTEQANGTVHADAIQVLPAK